MLETDFDQEIKDILELDIEIIKNQIKVIKVSVLLNGEYDKENAIVEIHAGAGGTEACDWAMMLYRMYERYFSKKGYIVEIVDEQAGDGAGIKSVSMLIKGNHVYGYLKSEKGVHRLIRLSPFDSNNRRHTSFASVDVTPLFDNQKINIEIKDSDIKIDVYRSTGAGGQSVNTTDSAVRITHLPTKIVVTCQNERSQIQNKEKALEILKNKLYKLELEKRNQELKNIKGNQKDINFGSQIRSYIMHPYSLVKDHRTNTETSNVNKVLDGDIDMFISDYLLNN
jgi:peptide chain release factor 2